jgi:arsenate reductase (thioredoxin)
MADKKTVLILCTGNSARSQMAEGLLRHDAGERFEVESAGTKPGQVRPEAIALMKELGIDISGHRSKPVDEFAERNFDYVLTGCDNAQESCPIYRAHASRLNLFARGSRRVQAAPILINSTLLASILQRPSLVLSWCGLYVLRCDSIGEKPA